MRILIKLAVFVSVSTLLFPQAASSEETDLSSKVKKCSQINESQARLSCFDALTGKSSLTDSNTSELLTSGKLVPNKQEIDDFAKNHVQKSAEELAKEINSITLVIDKLKKSVRGQWKMTFKNGQKWQQHDAIRITLKQGERVILTKGALGSVYMQKENSNKRIKVKRLK